MKNLKTKLSYALYTLLVAVLLVGCNTYESTPRDLEPIINGKFKDAKAVYYPSTSRQVSAIVVDKDGNVWYLRMNMVDQMRDEKQLFNVSEHCN
jgi:predicted small secreted protein